MNARSESAPVCFTQQLPTGLLEVELHRGADELDDLLGFAARANAKRGFLFVSKVLGKHWPVRPSRMLAIHERLAASMPAAPGPVLFIAMAETAVGLGQGVFEAWLRAHPNEQALFLQTTRYRVGTGPIIEFEESHSHAPRQFLHLPAGAREQALLRSARTIVLVDDEASTGNTFLNLTQACRRLNPLLERVHLAVLANFMGAAATQALSVRFDLPATMGALLEGAYRFTANDAPVGAAPAQRYEESAERGASTAFGRLGLARALRTPEALASELARTIAPQDKVLVLGTGEFMHPSTLLGAALERHGLDVVVQSTTRSPILIWGAIEHAMGLPDNYGEGIPNFVYNVAPCQYRHVLICHETPAGAALLDFARALNARLFHYHTEDDVEEVPVR
jgi:hypothetical protein